MLDFLNNELKIEDQVIFYDKNYREFKIGTITKFTNYYVFITYDGERTIKQHSSQLIKYNGERD